MKLKAFLQATLFSHLVIAAGTALLCLQTQLFLGYTPQNLWLYVFLFFATLLSYNTHFFLASRKSSASEQLAWFRNRQGLVMGLTVFCLLLVVVSGWQVRHLFPELLPALVLNAAYTAPLLFTNEMKLPLPFTFIKSYFIGCTWAYVTVILPLSDLQAPFSLDVALLFINRFFLVSIATLIFDWRDRHRDLQWGVITPANLFSEQQFRYFFLANLFVYSAVTVQLAVTTEHSFHYLQLFMLPVMWQLYRLAYRQTSDSFYLLYVDGLLVLSPLLSLFLLF